MIIDYRIYATVAVLAVMLHFAAFPFIGRRVYFRGTDAFYLIEGTAATALLLTAFAAFFDWLWS